MTTQELNLIENEAKSVSEQVKSLTIVNQSSYEKGATIKISLSGLRKKIKIFFDPMVDKAKASYDEIRTQRDKFLKPTVAIEYELKDKLKTYERQKEHEAMEARRLAELDRIRKQKEAEQKAKDEAEVFDVDEKEIKVDEVEVEQPLPTIEKVTGLGIRRNWKARVVDVNKIPIQYLLPDMVTLNRMARETKKASTVAGVEFYED